VNNDTTLLLGLNGLAVEHVELDADGVPVVHVITADEQARRCPSCGLVSSSLKERVLTRPRDLPVGGNTVRLLWHKHRWRCGSSQCPKQTFTETVPQVPARARLTTRLRQAAGSAVATASRVVSEVAASVGVSWPVVHAAFTARAAATLPAGPAPVEVLGIDETRRGRPKYTVDPLTGKSEETVGRWHTGFVDLTGTQGLLGQVEGRTSEDAVAWLEQQPESWRARIGFVAIDMSASYRAAVRRALPAATIVVDHFHVVQPANRMLCEVRRRLTFQHRGRRGRRTDPEWISRNRLTRNWEDLTDEQVTKMWTKLDAAGPIGTGILTAWIAKEELRTVLACNRDRFDRGEVRKRLYTFYTWCAGSGITEIKRLATTVETWWDGIEAFLRTGITNAKSEGINRAVKLAARNAYGFRNPENQRLRTRSVTNKVTMPG
jgi:transposase